MNETITKYLYWKSKQNNYFVDNPYPDMRESDTVNMLNWIVADYRKKVIEILREEQQYEERKAFSRKVEAFMKPWKGAMVQIFPSIHKNKVLWPWPNI